METWWSGGDDRVLAAYMAKNCVICGIYVKVRCAGWYTHTSSFCWECVSMETENCVWEIASFGRAGLCGRSVRTFVEVARNSEPPLLPTWVSVYDVFLSVFAEATCSPFDKIYLFLAFGFKTLVDDELYKFEATDAEWQAFEKVQECFRVAGVEGKILNIKFLVNFSLP